VLSIATLGAYKILNLLFPHQQNFRLQINPGFPPAVDVLQLHGIADRTTAAEYVPHDLVLTGVVVTRRHPPVINTRNPFADIRGRLPEIRYLIPTQTTSRGVLQYIINLFINLFQEIEGFSCHASLGVGRPY
jgi:hypothetical protein